jgi:predicted RNase H-like HicB family nuclease
MDCYYGVFLPAREGGYVVEFPDFPEIASQGDDLAEAIHLGADALALALGEYARERREIPPPSSLEAVKKWAARQKNDPALRFGEAVFQLFPVPETDPVPVRISVSLPRTTLELVDVRAARQGLTRSGYLAAAALAYKPSPRSAAARSGRSLSKKLRHQ